MRNIATISIEDRNDLFRSTASKIKMTEAVVEKDFWVCFMLDYLFHRCPWKNKLVFKGGTSLSKAYGLINRFSEDIDLILDWRILGYNKDEPWKKRSNTKQDFFNKEANIRAEEFLKKTFMPTISKELSEELQTSVNLYIEEDDPQTIKFKYPISFFDRSILQEIRLEIGALAAWTPAKTKTITPYVAEEYPQLFYVPNTEILTVLPERTFWEKVTILHREAFRTSDKLFPARYSRHYYDLFRMAQTEVKENALSDKDLLKKVVAFKEKFYRCSWAKYELATFGSMKLMPPEHNLKALFDDYEHMKNMLFGEKPNFDEILQSIRELEKAINTRI